MKSRLIINKTEVVAENGIVAAMHPLAAEAGLEILQEGGNAADAAVTAAFASGVVEPFMSGLGGAAYIMYHDAAGGHTLTFDGCVVCPRAAREEMFELLDPSESGSSLYGWRATKDDAAETGYRSVLVPGAVAAYCSFLEKCGSMPLSRVMEPAVRLAEEGFEIDWYVFANCASSLARLKTFPETMAIFFRPDGTPWCTANHDDNHPPDCLVQADLARTMRMIMEQGPDVFYRGEVAKAIVEHLSANGGILTQQDLAEYQVRIREPMCVNYRGYRVEMISENSGGPTVGQALNILEGFDLRASDHNMARSLHLIAEATRLAFADRFSHLGDPAFAPIPLEGLLSKEYAVRCREKIRLDRGPVPEPVGDPWPCQPDGKPAGMLLANGGDCAKQHTTHMTVVDSKRNMVSLTASVGQRFGSGVVIPDTGICMNNGMMWFDPEPGKINSIVPGKHALHAGTPAFVFDEQGPLLALGAPGGRKVLTAVMQVMLNVLDFEMGIQSAISAPRIHCETGPLQLDRRLPAETIEGLRSLGHAIELREEHYLSSYFGRPNGILIDRDEGVLRGGVEPFRVSMAVGY